MSTMLDCIRRTAPTVKSILENAQKNTDDLVNYLKDNIRRIDEIILIGSGSSYNAIVTATAFIEEVSGLQAHGYLPNNFRHKSVHNDKALYIFVSQSGTSGFVEDEIRFVNEKGYLSAAITDNAESPIAKAAGVHVPLGVGGEEFGFRTVGFVSSFVSLMTVALRIGLERGHISASSYNEYLADGMKAVENHPHVVEKSLEWFDRHKEALKPLDSVMYYGCGCLYGIALEGALKLLEVPKIYLSAGFEAEDGFHGPCYAFNEGDIVIGLNDGSDDEHLIKAIVNFSKHELGQGYIIGANPIDDDDLGFEIASKHFTAVELAPAVEVISYEMALINDVEVLPISQRVRHASSKYFSSHRG